MKYSILGFNQAKVMETNLDLTDLVLLEYIIQANGSPKMTHLICDDIPYVWINHNKLQEDLPILGISEGTLRNRLSTLKKEGFLLSTTERNSRGSKTFYSVSELTINLLFDDSMSLQNDIRCNFKMTSDNKLIDNNSNSNTKVLEEKPKKSESNKLFNQQKPKKKNLYEKSMDDIDSYVDTCKFIKSDKDKETLKGKLVEYLTMRLKLDKFKSFMSIINKLDERCDNLDDALITIDYSISHEYKGLFKPTSSNNQSNPRTSMQVQASDAKSLESETDAIEFTDMLKKEAEKNGQRAVF